MMSKFPPTMMILVKFLQCKVDYIKIETISGTLTQRQGFVGLSMTSKTEKLNTGARKKWVGWFSSDDAAGTDDDDADGDDDGNPDNQIE